MNELNTIPNSIFSCKGCGNTIKIAQCPHCNTFYTVSIPFPQKTEYRVKCLKCHNDFTINFPLSRQPLQQDQPFNRYENREQERKDYFTKTAAVEKRDIDGKNTAADVMDVFFWLNGSLSPKRLLVGLATVLISTLFAVPASYLLNLAGATLQIPSGIRNLTTLIPALIVFNFFILASAVICRISMEEDRGIKPGFPEIIGYASRLAVPSFTANILLLVSCASLLIFFGEIPVAGPVIFGLVFLPVYMILLATLILSVIGFWFYPPLIADRYSGPGGGFGNFIAFIRKHNFRLSFVIPLLTIISLSSFLALFALHYGTVAIAMILIKLLRVEGAAVSLSSLPPLLHKASMLSLMESDYAFMKTIVSGIAVAGEISGFLIGTVLAFFSIILFSVLVSIISTASAEFYRVLEKNWKIDDRAMLYLLGIMTLFLAGILLLKKIL